MAILRRPRRGAGAAPVEKRKGRGAKSPRPRLPFAAVSSEALSEGVTEYLDELAARGYRTRTVDTYRKALGRLGPTLGRVAGAAELLRELRALAPATRALYLSVARAFDRWLVETGRRPRQVLAGAARVKLDQAAPRPLESGELRRLDQAAAKWGPGWDRGRTRLLYLLLRETGMRIGEALGLRWGDVVLEPGREGLQLATTKGRAPRLVPLLPGPLLTYVKAAARPRGAAARPVAEAFVLSIDVDTGERPWSYRAALVAWDKLTAKAGVDATPHRMRHTRATELAAQGASAFVVRSALGWAKLDTAARYVRAPELRAELARLTRSSGRGGAR
jgi:integrase/recombinase XerC